jgi:Ca-activated chloride channel family protein
MTSMNYSWIKNISHYQAKPTNGKSGNAFLVVGKAILVWLLLGQFSVTAQEPASGTVGLLNVVLNAKSTDAEASTQSFEWTIINSDTEAVTFADDDASEVSVELSPGSFDVIVIGGPYSAERSIEVSATGENHFVIALNRAGKAFAIESPDKVSAGSPLTVSWKGPEGDRGRLFITSPMTADNRYVRGGNSLQVSEGSSGLLVAPVKPGTYEIRYFSEESNSLAERQPLLVTDADVAIDYPTSIPAGSMIDFSWSGPQAPGDRIFTAAKGMAHNSYITTEGKSFKVGSDQKPSIIAPARAGEYEIRYFSGRNGTPLARFPFTVTDAEVTIEAPRVVTGGTKFDFNWTGPASSGDFLFFTGSNLAHNKYWTKNQHKVGDGSAGQFTVPTEPGSYEIRYFSYLNGTVLAKRVIVVR